MRYNVNGPVKKIKEVVKLLEVGTQVRNFMLPDAQGNVHELKNYHGKKVVIYFYPKDHTPGCTTQALAFRESHEQLKQLDVVVIGISKDDEASHQKFIKDYDLPFILLSDKNAEVAKQFGVYVEKKMFGKTFMGFQRSTFILDEEGKVIHVFKKASPKKNASEIVEILSK